MFAFDKENRAKLKCNNPITAISEHTVSSTPPIKFAKSSNKNQSTRLEQSTMEVLLVEEENPLQWYPIQLLNTGNI